MKKILLSGILIICSVIFNESCYKTGEIIYQPTCKPLEMNLFAAQYNFLYILRREFFHATFTYDGKRRLISANSFLQGNPDRKYEFIYDGNNNLVRINTFDLRPNQPLIPIIYITFNYPFGTKNSISDRLDVQFNYLNNDLVTYSSELALTYHFNTEFQLVSIYQGNSLWETLEYDVNGNCLLDNVYNSNPDVQTYFKYDSYDNEINPGRADRSLQLLLQMYSKNNPTSSARYVKGFGGSGSGYGVLYGSNGSYTYNSNGYPLTYSGYSPENFYADYDCFDPRISPGPGITNITK